MGVITAITAQKNNTKRANIFIDGEYRCSLDKMTVLACALKIGEQIDDERLKAITLDSEQKSAFDAAIKLISGRMKSEHDIEKYLKGKGYDEQVVTSTLQKLKEYKYISDESFTKAYIRTYRTKYGNKKLFFELNMRGISDEIVQKCLDEDDDDEFEAAQTAAQKYVRTHAKATFAKLANFLYSRGFSGEIAKEIAKKYALDAQNED